MQKFIYFAYYVHVIMYTCSYTYIIILYIAIGTKWLANDTKKVFDEFNLKLVKQLPLKDAYFLAALTQLNLSFSWNSKG